MVVKTHLVALDPRPVPDALPAEEQAPTVRLVVIARGVLGRGIGDDIQRCHGSVRWCGHHDNATGDECRLEAGVVEAADDAEDGLAVPDGGVQGD